MPILNDVVKAEFIESVIVFGTIVMVEFDFKTVSIVAV